MLQASKAGAKQRAVPFWEAVNLITTCFKIMQIDVTLLFLCRDRRRRRGRERNNKRRGFVFGIRLRVVGRVYRRLINVERYCLPDTHTHTHEHQYANSTALLRPYKFLQHSPHFAVSYDLREDAGSHSEISVCASVCVCGCVCFRVALVQNSLHRLLAKKNTKTDSRLFGNRRVFFNLYPHDVKSSLMVVKTPAVFLSRLNIPP